jgi:hypothetical protein
VTASDCGLTVQALAEAKHLPVDFLRNLGVRDQKRYGVPVVVIPFLDEGGQEATIRYRHRLDSGGQRFSCRRGDHPMLYGLHRRNDVRKAGWVMLVEGESDCWTCWYHGIPAFGIPGKKTWQPEWASYCDGLDVFLWQEPDAADLAAEVARDLPELQIIAAPDGTKDLSETHCRGDDVAALVKQLKKQAQRASNTQDATRSAARDKLWSVAAAVLEDDDPLTLIETEIERLGYGGDLAPAKITYLCLTTRLLKMRRGAMPAHLLLLGPPSTGKSYTLGTVVLLLPAEAVHTIDAGSPRVLIYDDADLRYRVLIFAEADSLPAGEDNPAASAIRNLLQDHYLHYQVTIPDPETGDFTVRHIEKAGPTVLVTTAVKALGWQMMTRLFSLPVPEDVERLRQALETQATLELDGAVDPSAALIAMQGYVQTLAPWDVVVPFARELATAIGASANAARILRDYQRLLSLIKAVTILRHRRRERDSAGRWEATIEDYRALYGLVQPMFETTISGKTEAVRKVVDAVATLADEDLSPITYSAVSRKINMHVEQVRRAVTVAVEHEWLINDQDKPNRPASLRVGEPMPESTGLPTPEQVEAAYTIASEPSPDLHDETPEDAANFTVSQPDRRERTGTFPDEGEASPSMNGRADGPWTCVLCHKSPVEGPYVTCPRCLEELSR